MPLTRVRTFRHVDPRSAGATDLVGIGGELTVERLVWAYRIGIFPWPTPGYPMLWFCPRQRAVLDFAALRVPERLARYRRNTGLTCTVDMAFDDVLAGCRQAPRPGQEGTWITEDVQRAYGDLHRVGYAHSVEVWDEAGALAGGLYGVVVDGTFAGESMFYRAPNASKIGLLYLVDHLRERGLDWIDMQMLTPHMAALGAAEVTRTAFLDRLAATQARGLTLFP
jgi:leucyl/phenylalanyl-tRNA--protein transferase